MKNEDKNYTLEKYQKNFLKNLKLKKRKFLKKLEKEIYEDGVDKIILNKPERDYFDLHRLKRYLETKFPFLKIDVESSWTYVNIYISNKTSSDELEEKIKELNDKYEKDTENLRRERDIWYNHLCSERKENERQLKDMESKYKTQYEIDQKQIERLKREIEQSSTHIIDEQISSINKNIQSKMDDFIWNYFLQAGFSGDKYDFDDIKKFIDENKIVLDIEQQADSDLGLTKIIEYKVTISNEDDFKETMLLSFEAIYQ